MNQSQEEEIQKLIRLKRHEAPPEEYFEEFLEEFQNRQRGGLLRQSSFGLFKDRLGTWFRELGSIKWVAGAGVAYAGVTAAILLWPATPVKMESQNLAPASYQPDKGRPLPTVDFPKIEKTQSGSTTPREF
ncbi:hypothetical protein N9A94_03060 [Akkermansiaceae bacterium]|nr:hypothetical protein [Akkermansiaceae bacterium]